MRIENGMNDTMPITPSQSGGSGSRTEAAKPEMKIQKSTLEVQKKHHEEVEKIQDVKQQVEEKQVIDAIEKANKTFKTYERRLEFSIHDKTKEIMVKVINTEDDSVIREIPSEKVLDMVAHMYEISGILVDEKR